MIKKPETSENKPVEEKPELKKTLEQPIKKENAIVVKDISEEEAKKKAKTTGIVCAVFGGILLFCLVGGITYGAIVRYGNNNQGEPVKFTDPDFALYDKNNQGLTVDEKDYEVALVDGHAFLTSINNIPEQATTIVFPSFKQIDDKLYVISGTSPDENLNIFGEAPSNIQNIYIANFYQTLAPETFKGLTTLEKWFMSTGNLSFIFTVEESLFEGCTSLSEISLPLNTSVIQDKAFKDCTSLTTLDLPIGLQSIEGSPFTNSGVTTLNYAGTTAEFNSLSKSSTWRTDTKIATIVCNDGTITY